MLAEKNFYDSGDHSPYPMVVVSGTLTAAIDLPKGDGLAYPNNTHSVACERRATDVHDCFHRGDWTEANGADGWTVALSNSEMGRLSNRRRGRRTEQPDVRQGDDYD